MHRIRKHVPIYLRERGANSTPLKDYIPQGLWTPGDGETLENGLVRRWCHGTPGKG